ncbi:MAG: hypothetical protein JWO31_1985, partial [Phycisphaerales bacterium]|nr:hypothetical protein [Phycisphaerales bacterium]
YQRNQFRYGQTLAAQKSGVPLAKAYVATGPAAYPKAEAALRATLESPLITPEAEEFREALFELAQLYYRTGRFEDAVQRLTELTDRYPRDDRAGQTAFLMADSYRKSAQLLAADTKPAASAADDPMAVARQVAARAEAAAARQDRLFKARRLYDRAIDRYRAAGVAEAAAANGSAAAVPDLDKLYLKLAYFYRADCAYDAGRFDEAVGLYDQAALKYRDDPSALTAYVQIVNAYAALGRRDEARAANERAQWLLKRMPADAFREARLTMPQKSWEDWMAWSKSAGLW